VATNLSPKTSTTHAALLQSVSRVSIPLFFLLYLLGVFSLFATSWTTAQPFTEFVILHPSFVRLITAISSAICALLFFWPREGSRLVGRWGDYIGLAFLMFAVQYGLRFTQLLIEGRVSQGVETAFTHFSLILIYLCSAVNNLFFLGAARILLNWGQGIQEAQPLKDYGRGLAGPVDTLPRAFADFRRTIPRWAWFLACTALVTAFLDASSGFLWARLPDALFSAYCLGWFGYAIAVNLNIRLHRVLAATALIVSLAYGAGQLMYATNPIIAYSLRVSDSSNPVLRWVRDTIGYKVGDLTLLTNSTTGMSNPPKVYLDTAVYTILLPVRFALFLVAFTLYLLFIISINDFRRALSETTNVRKDYLSSGGIVRAIGKSMAADRVLLFIRLPGAEKREVLRLAWDHVDEHPPSETTILRPAEHGPLLSRVLGEGGEAVCVSSEGKANGAAGAQPHVAPPQSLLLVPVKFHGAVIGGVQVELEGYGKSNFTALQKLRLMAEIVAPSVQDYRALAAVDQLGYRLTRLHVDHPLDNLGEAVTSIAEVLQDILVPLATALHVEVGFSSITRVCPAEGQTAELLKDFGGGSGEEGIQAADADAGVSVERLLLLNQVREEGQGSMMLGWLRFAISAQRDELSRPTLAGYYLSRKAVASLTADGVLNFARDHFGLIIKDLGFQFNQEELSDEDWFEAVNSAALRAGLSWVLVTEDEPEGRQVEQPLVHVTPGLVEGEKILFGRVFGGNGTSRPDFTAEHVVGLHLPMSKRCLWFGVDREGFGPELEFESPWKSFLYDLAKIADAALDNILKRRDADVAQLNAAMSQGVITIAVTTGTLMHQLLNMVRDQIFATEALEEELRADGSPLNARSSSLLRAMRASAYQMRELTTAFSSVTSMQGPFPCAVREAAEEAVKLFKVAFTQGKIEVNIDVPPALVAALPFHVAAFALANVIGNAKDAIWHNGQIKIEAEENGNFILCHVTNNGPEISPGVRGQLFTFGMSAKEGHNGWGLYFAKRALIENGGDIYLAYSEPAATRFTVLMPKINGARRE
jgi:signal transduction histidine kinase